MNAVIMPMESESGLVSKGQKGPHRYRFGILFSFLLSVVLVWSVWQLMNPATLPIRYVGIEGEFRHLVPSMLEESVAKVVRGGFFNVNVEKIQETLLLEPWVKHIAVRRVWPYAITVHVQEQNAVARWGEQGLLNTEGEFFAPAKSTIPTGLPILRGPENTEILLMEYKHYVEKLLIGSSIGINEIILNERRAWIVMLNNGLVINLGKQNVKERLEYFSNYVLFQLAGSLSEISVVDMRYTNGFAVRLKNDSSIVKSEQK